MAVLVKIGLNLATVYLGTGVYLVVSEPNLYYIVNLHYEQTSDLINQIKAEDKGLNPYALEEIANGKKISADSVFEVSSPPSKSFYLYDKTDNIFYHFYISEKEKKQTLLKLNYVGYLQGSAIGGGDYPRIPFKFKRNAALRERIDELLIKRLVKKLTEIPELSKKDTKVKRQIF